MTDFENIYEAENIQEQIRVALRKIASQIDDNSDSYSLNYKRAYFNLVHTSSALLDLLQRSIANKKEISNKYIYLVLATALNIAEDICIDEEIEAMENPMNNPMNMGENELEILGEKVAEYLQNDM